MTLPLVSVIMPTFNDRPEFLKESIESILNQTYNNLELIIADDSTSEESINIINYYASKDDRIVVNRKEGRKGISVAVNDAISLAKGEYIAHMDADDVSLPQRLEHQMLLFDSSNIAVVGGYTINIDENGHEAEHPFILPCDDKKIKEGFIEGWAYILNPTSIVRKKIFDEVGGYEEMWKCAEDYDMWYRIAALGYGFANVPEVVLKYRIGHGANDHIRMSSLIPKYCCMARLKYAIGFSRRLKEREFNNLEQIVDNSFLCRLSIAATYNNGSFVFRIIRKFNLRNKILSISKKYFTKRREYYLSRIEN